MLSQLASSPTREAVRCYPCLLQEPHRIGRPLCLENPRPKGGMLIHATMPPPPLAATEHSRCGSHWPAKVAPSAAATNISVGYVV